VGLESAKNAQREIRNKLKQKYTREAVDDYHKGTIEILRVGTDTVKGTRKHFKQRKRYKLEKAKYKLQKAEFKLKEVQNKGGYVGRFACLKACKVHRQKDESLCLAKGGQRGFRQRFNARYRLCETQSC
jgi:hypothetical protein